MKLILASASPRRRELLQQIGLSFIVRPADSEPDVSGLSPEETVQAIALGKARSVAAESAADDLILAADTLVYLDGQPLGKPKSPDEAAAMLQALSGREHHVCTGVALLQGPRCLVSCEKTAVRFRPLSPERIAAYVASGEPMDKAGAYGIQGLGCLLVEGITGDYFNVVGLPLGLVSDMLARFGYPVLNEHTAPKAEQELS